MKFVTTKDMRILALPGIDIDYEMTDSQLTSITFSADGEFRFRLRKETYGGFQLEIHAPKPTKEVWRLSGTVPGIPLTQDFDDQYKANDEKRRFEARCEEDGCKLTVEKTTVEINEKENSDDIQF